MIEFKPFGKIPRLCRPVIVSEKIDGTNALIYIGEDGEFLTGSRSRWITPEDDNFGFSRWAHEHKDELMALGPGYHYGEWWGQGIQRKYGLMERRFSLFNTSRWSESRPACCHVVPVLATGIDISYCVEMAMHYLVAGGSKAVPGFMAPEGVIAYHVASGQYFKRTIRGDDEPKGQR